MNRTFSGRSDDSCCAKRDACVSRPPNCVRPNDCPALCSCDSRIETYEAQAATIRAEFGEAFDLHVRCCVIVSYLPVSLSTCDAARRLGLEIEALGLGTSIETDRAPGELAKQLRQLFDSADERSRFTDILSTAARDSESKELVLRRRD